jgi:hypothetical protein
MPLLDHFNPPLNRARHWESFHSRWAGAIFDALNVILPKPYFAEMQVHIGSRVEVDIATLHDAQEIASANSEDGGGGVATLARTWAPPVATMSMSAIFPDSIEVLVYNMESGYTLVAAVELISPGNKDRPATRRGFAAKCATYLQQGIGLVIVDVVTNQSGNLHNELVELMGVGERFVIGDAPLYAVAYRPIREENTERIDVWPVPLAIGKTLPTLPLSLDKGMVLPLDLETPYTEACQRSRLPV